MKQGEGIIIERAANGWMVRSFMLGMHVNATTDLLVFQDMGYASGSGAENKKTEDCLLGFIAQHFQTP